MNHQDDEAFDNYVAKRTRVRADELRAKLAAGDAVQVATVDDHLGVLLFDSASWAALIQSTAQGKNAFAELMDKAIAAIAECRALKDAEEAEQERKRNAAEYRYESMREARRIPMYH